MERKQRSKVKPPTNDPIRLRDYEWALEDELARRIITYISQQEKPPYFNELANVFGDRKAVFGRLLRLVDAGIIQADMVLNRTYGTETPIKSYVRQYTIPFQGKEWVEANFK